NQIIGMDHQRAKAQLRTACAEAGGIGFAQPRARFRPHAGTPRENRERVAAEIAGRFKRYDNVTGNGGVDAYAYAAVTPCEWQGFRFRFWAVFVGTVVDRYSGV